VLVVSGIWPPDVGGPASHAPAVADFLHRRGHQVVVVVTADAEPAPRPYPVRWTPRRLPVGVRHLHALALIAGRARGADVVYTTGMFGRSGLGALAARTPYVVKLTGDPAFERLRARGAVGGDVDEFARGGGGPAGHALRALRNLVVRRAARVHVPSEWLRQRAIAWGADPGRVDVVPNTAPEPPAESRARLRERLRLDGLVLAFAGRLTAQKGLDVLLRAVAAVDDVRLVVAGEGEERGAVERLVRELRLDGRVDLLGARPREQALELLAAADAAVLASGWENLPHAVVEALAVGTPVIATRVGGVPEVVVEGENGLLVPPGDPDALAAAIRRFRDDRLLRDALTARAAPSVERYSAEAVLGQLERVLEDAAR
jgi:glycosyltransferase involved in cell wall biosynthesis